ncbi:MAG: hypothetical protein ABI134_33645 [Byssovorax sp.]
MSIEQYSVNQNRFTFASGYITLNEVKYPGLQGMTPKDEVASELIYGSGQIAVGKTRGPYKPSLTFEILMGEGGELQKALGTPLDSKPFDVSGTFIENGSIDNDFTIQIDQVTWKTSEIGMSNDQKALVLKVEVTVILPISWNGIYLVDQPDSFDAAGFGFSVTLF